MLADTIAAILPESVRVLDVGAGDGAIASSIMRSRPDVRIAGVDVLVRDDAAIPVTHFDGRSLDGLAKDIDVVMFVDVLHHTDAPEELLREAARVARRAVLVKDHLRNGLLARTTLRMMDNVGNERFGVSLPYNYLNRQEWQAAFVGAGLRVATWQDRLGLYPPPLSWFFERGLHFVTLLKHSVDG